MFLSCNIWNNYVGIIVNSIIWIGLKMLKSVHDRLDNSIPSYHQHYNVEWASLVVLLHPFVQQGWPFVQQRFALVSCTPEEGSMWHGLDHQSQMLPVLQSIHQHHSATWPGEKFLQLSQWKPLKETVHASNSVHSELRIKLYSSISALKSLLHVEQVNNMC